MRRWLAWGVHFFTACGAVAGAGALLAVVGGAWHTAVLLMLAAIFIDSVDGMMARAVGVAQEIPSFDGRRLDDIADFVNFVIVPVVFMVANGLLPHWAWIAPPILASAYGFSHTEAKTDDDFFLGWPSYWNVFAIYAWLLETPAWLNATLTVLLTLLIFVPFKYVYPTRLRVWKRTTYVASGLCMLLVVASVLDPEMGRAWHLPALSLLFPAWYYFLSIRLGGLHRPDRPAVP